MAVISRAARRTSVANAHMLKSGGGGATATAPRQSAMGWKDALIGAVGGFITGGPAGAVAGGVAGLAKPGPATQPPAPPRPTMGSTALVAPGAAAMTPCTGNRIMVPGIGCVDPLAAPPGGAPFITTPTGTQVTRGGGAAVVGAFGLPALQPAGIARTVLKCARGMVLGKDNLCYPKAILGRRSTWRKWRQPPRPPVSSGDVAAIRRAERARGRVLELGKDVGLTLKKAPRKKK